MSRRQSFLAYLALLVGVIAFASSFARPTSGQPDAQGIPANNSAVAGRYQSFMAYQGGAAYVVVTDSATGQSWTRAINDNAWNDLGIPKARR